MAGELAEELSTKHVNVDVDDVEKVISAIKSRSLSGNSGIVEEYESALETTFSTRHAIAYANGTATLQGALHAAGVSRGDDVLLPPTCPAMTALPILNIGATPVFVDVRSDNSLSIDPESLERRLTPETEAIISIPMWGYPTDIDAVTEIVADRDVTVIEDAAQAHGAKIGDSYVGTNADIGSFSTHHRKLICTGEGGFLLTDSDDHARAVAELRNFGKCEFSRKQLDSESTNFGDKFGMNYKFNAMGAAMGLAQLEKFEAKLEQRRSNARYLVESLSQAGGPNEIPTPSEYHPNYYALVLESPDSEQAGRKISERLAEDGVISDTYAYDYKPLYELPLFSEYRADCPNAEALAEKIFTVPTHEGLDRTDLEYIVEAVLSADTE